MEIKQTPATAAVGCGGSLIFIGSFISGFYLGHSQATGNTIDPNLTKILKYGPAFIGGAYSVMTSNVIMDVPGNLESMVKDMPSQPGVGDEQKVAAAKGCLPVFGGLMGSAVMGGLTYLGYAVGHALGK